MDCLNYLSMKCQIVTRPAVCHDFSNSFCLLDDEIFLKEGFKPYVGTQAKPIQLSCRLVHCVVQDKHTAKNMKYTRL